jgi:DNA polymerase-1
MKLMEDIRSEWEVIELNNLNYTLLREMYWKDRPKIIGTDTETDGLNLLHNKPFDYIFGWVTETHKVVFAWTEEDAPYARYEWKELLQNGDYRYHFCWNAVFDASMLLNVGIDIRRNIADGQALLRLVQKADNEWGSKALKKVAVQYLASDADIYEKEIKEYLKIEKSKWQKLRRQWVYKDWTYKAMQDKDNEVPEEIKNAYKEWLVKNPEPNYTCIPKDILRRYDSCDVILLLELVLLFYPYVVKTEQLQIFEEECAIIPAVIEQCRTGLKVDVDYLKESDKILAETIKNYRQQLYGVLGKVINPNQNEQIAVWLEENGIVYQTETVYDKRKKENVTKKAYKADKETLKKIYRMLGQVDVSKLTPEQKSRRERIMRVCELVEPLRTFEKWRSTYIKRILENVEENKIGRFLPKYDAYGAVSGRFTSDFQQYPRGGIFVEGKEIFNPRRAFLADEDYALVYIDYSQIELRLAGTMTVLAGQPDKVVLNAYTNWDKVENWKPTDMHLEMTKNAFDLTPEQVSAYEKYEEGLDLTVEETKMAKYVKEHRSIAKIANFSALYNGGPKAINDGCFDGNDLEKAKYVSAAHKKTFPGLINYQKWVAQKIVQQGYVRNLLGRMYKYELNDYKAQSTAANYIIQGTGADFLKGRMAECFELLKDKKSKLVGNIHDEMQFLIHKEEQFLIPKLKKIMESNADFSVVPIIADVEISWTNWAEKKNWHEQEINKNETKQSIS